MIGCGCSRTTGVQCTAARASGTPLRCSLDTSARVGVPMNCMAPSVSCLRMSSVASTPACPYAARPYSAARPMPTAFAPSASALKTSVPRVIPPSRRTSKAEPSNPGSARKASITSTSASSVGRAVSRLRPPWLLTTIPARPSRKARTASAPVCTPLSRTGVDVMLRIQARSAQERSSAHRRCVALERGAVPPGVNRRSLSRLPMPALSTVRNNALNPSRSASRIVASAAFRSFSTYS
mmetsp:Transcript_24727/g.80865  ORF Transcript_24727/g.80865 Transcript_24727/m.80865 type:complete len:238 (-) Transcript_24727:1561-2274(-)